jgi:hypothetical protein
VFLSSQLGALAASIAALAEESLEHGHNDERAAAMVAQVEAMQEPWRQLRWHTSLATCAAPPAPRGGISHSRRTSFILSQPHPKLNRSAPPWCLQLRPDRSCFVNRDAKEAPTTAVLPVWEGHERAQTPPIAAFAHRRLHDLSGLEEEWSAGLDRRPPKKIVKRTVVDESMYRHWQQQGPN